MSEQTDIVTRLMDYDQCHDDDVDEAAAEITSLRKRLTIAENAMRQAVGTLSGVLISRYDLAMKLQDALDQMKGGG